LETYYGDARVSQSVPRVNDTYEYVTNHSPSFVKHS